MTLQATESARAHYHNVPVPELEISTTKRIDTTLSSLVDSLTAEVNVVSSCPGNDVSSYTHPSSSRLTHDYPPVVKSLKSGRVDRERGAQEHCHPCFAHQTHRNGAPLQ